MNFNFSKIFLLFIISLFLVSCSTVEEISDETVALFTSDEEDEESEAEEKAPASAEALYQEALGHLKERRYKTAIKNFEEIEGTYPFSKLATKSLVMIAYANYKDEEYDTAINVIERFIRLNPGNVDIAYMYYLKAVCFYDRIADIKRDQEITKEALKALKEVAKRYPESEYARDASLKVDLVYDHLAGKEMEIGRFYLRDKKYIAAVNRFRAVVTEYETTSHIAEALYRLTEAYLLLGVFPEAEKNAAVLGHNYPESRWYKRAYALVAEGKNFPDGKADDSWFSNIVDFDDGEKVKDLPKDNKADSWLNRMIDAL